MTRFDKETLDALAQYEGYFYTAVNADWTRNPGHAALTFMHDAMTQFAGYTERLNESCNTCVLRFVKETGAKYYADRQAAIDAENDARAVKLSQTAATKAKKVKVTAAKS